MQSVLEITTPACRTATELEPSCASCAGTSPRPRQPLAIASPPPEPTRSASPSSSRSRRRSLRGHGGRVPVRRPRAADLRSPCARRGRRPRDGDQVVDGVSVYLPGAPRPVGELSLLARPSTGLVSCRQVIFATLPRSGLPAALRVLRGVRRGDRAAGTQRMHPRLHPDLVGRPSPPAPGHGRAARLRRGHPGRGHGRPGRLLPGTRPLPVRAGRVGQPPTELPSAPHHREQVARHPPRPRRPPARPHRRGDRLPLRELVGRRLAELAPHARELGSERELQGVAEILARGNGADAQLAAWDKGRDLVEVTRGLAGASEAA